MMEEPQAFLIALGVVSLIVGVAIFFLGIVLLLAGKKEWGLTFLVSAGVLFLLGVGICGPMLLFNLS
jgi:hypothetical protein